MQFVKSLANTMVEIASGYDGHPPRQSWEPGTTLAVYCKRVGLAIHPNGELGGPQFIRCYILQDSCQKKIMAHRERNVIQEIEHRKGIPDDVIFNRHIVYKFLNNFQTLYSEVFTLALNGGSQSGALKSMIYEHQSENCPCCNQIDTKEHRLTKCEIFAEIK